MDGKNKNIHDAFGQYNNSGDGLKNVSSSMWEPISAGRSSAQTAAPKKSTADKNARTGTGKSSTKKASSPKKKTASGKNSTGHKSLISEGDPARKSKVSAKKPAAEADKKTKTAKAKKNPPSRTPTGRDLRKDARQEQKHREELLRLRENYEKQLRNQKNHDEISQEINEGKRKKLVMKNVLTLASVLVFALIFIVLYCYSRGALVENIIIEGNSIYTSEEIQQAAGISVGKNMLSLREKKVRRDITTQLPYIKDVSMEYDLPDTLILTVSGTTDRYVISSQSGSLTLDRDGKVVSDAVSDINSGIFCAEGFDFQRFESGDTYKPDGVNVERFALLREMAELFEKAGIVDSAVINLRDTENVIVTVDGKIAVYFGDCKSLEEKVPYASGIIEQVRSAGKTGYIDMRFDLGYFKPGSMTIQ